MRKLLLLNSFLLLSLVAMGQVSYGNSVLSKYFVDIEVLTETRGPSLVVIMTSGKYRMSSHPQLFLQLMDDVEILLEGKVLTSDNNKDETFLAKHHFPMTSDKVSIAQFPVKESQIRKFLRGIKLLRLNTSPKTHEKKWKSDKIGKELYAIYKESAASGRQFFR